MHPPEIHVGGVRAQVPPQIVGDRGEDRSPGVELGEGLADVRAGRVGKDAGVIAPPAGLPGQRHRRGVIGGEQVHQQAPLDRAEVPAGYRAVVGEAMLLLAHRQGHLRNERPLRPKLREPVVERIEVTPAHHLRMDRQSVEQLSLPPDPKSTVLPALVLPGAAFGPMILPMVSAQEPQLLQPPMIRVVPQASQVLHGLRPRPPGTLGRSLRLTRVRFRAPPQTRHTHRQHTQPGCRPGHAPPRSSRSPTADAVAPARVLSHAPVSHAAIRPQPVAVPARPTSLRPGSGRMA
jgi:hypothetical protein